MRILKAAHHKAVCLYTVLRYSARSRAGRPEPIHIKVMDGNKLSLMDYPTFRKCYSFYGIMFPQAHPCVVSGCGGRDTETRHAFRI
jgi:hypothetical protein